MSSLLMYRIGILRSAVNWLNHWSEKFHLLHTFCASSLLGMTTISWSVGYAPHWSASILTKISIDPNKDTICSAISF